MNEIEAELTDPLHLGTVHYSVRTYRDGCKGPLCRAAHAHATKYGRHRRANKLLAAASGRFDPFLAYCVKHLEEDDRGIPVGLLYELHLCGMTTERVSSDPLNNLAPDLSNIA